LALARGLTWGLPAVASEFRAWRVAASSIADAEMRRHALSSLDTKRAHAAGAALFAMLPSRRHRSLLRLLVGYETIWDFLDTTSEHAPAPRNGRQLHLSLLDALDPAQPHTDYYRHHPWQETSYLKALIDGCRTWCLELPGFGLVRPALVAEAWLAQVLALNHEPSSEHREALLAQWANTQPPNVNELAWYELTAAASASLTVHALLALAADADRYCEPESHLLRDAYNPWISAATTMLDSFVDQIEDSTSGDHSYVAHYPNQSVAVLRVRWLIQQSLLRAGRLPAGERHVLIVAAMAAMYLSKDSARRRELRRSTRALVHTGGWPVALLLPVLRLWRIADRQSAV
jgi:tetraprenyl-beta-curcumene synthase